MHAFAVLREHGRRLTLGSGWGLLQGEKAHARRQPAVDARVLQGVARNDRSEYRNAGECHGEHITGRDGFGVAPD